MEALEVKGLIPDSPSARAEVQRGDQIVSVNGEAVRTMDDYARTQPNRPNGLFEVVVLRHHELLEFTLDLKAGKHTKKVLKGSKSGPPAAPSGASFWDMLEDED